MTDLFDFAQHAGRQVGETASAPEILVRVTVLLLAGMLLVVGLRRSSAALRHLVWVLSLMGALLIPPCSWAFPAWRWAILPEPSSPSAAPLRATDASRLANAPPGEPLAAATPPVTGEKPSPNALPTIAKTAPGAASPALIAAHHAWSWSMLLAAVWALGTFSGLVWLATGIMGAWYVAGRAQAAADPHWRHILQQLLAACGSRRLIEVRECPQASVPMTWGLRRPVILVPVESAAWSEATKRSVLLHELGHIRRGDCLMYLLGRLACVVYWFHPLVWLAARQMRKTGERAADDVVLSSNIGPPEYAEHLVAIASQMRGIPLFGQVALPMATLSDLEGRVLAILDPRRNHGNIPRQTYWALTIAAALVLLLCALLRPGYAADKKAPEQVAAATNSPSDNLFVADAEQGSAPKDGGTASEPSATKPAAADAIVEAVGWRYARVGMKREELIEAMGEPGNESPPGVLRWPDKHVDCTFYTGSKAVSEVRFNEGFQGALANGIKLGSSGDQMLKLYGEPDFVTDNRNGAKMYNYTSKGILFWTNHRKIMQIVVFKPYRPAWDKPAPESRELSTVYRPFAGDDKLTEAQRIYCQWDAKTLGVPAPARWNALSAGERAAAENKFFKQLSSDQEDERVEAIDALVALGSKRAVRPILQIAAERKEKDNWDRETACRALGMLGDRSVVPELVHLTYHFNWNTRQWAQISLVRLTGQNFGHDVAAWKSWWEKQGGEPPISTEKVTWATSKRLLSMLKGAEDPEKQDEMDRQTIEMMKKNLEKHP